ncbi:MAG: hypothetical protein FJX68_17825 [Alphaproteobacteria bacterium]|nr:hypothetical protein [Alphaproteobacteria bacterium]
MADAGTEVYAVLQRPGRIWAVAAIHGEAALLARLHAALAGVLRRGDRLVYLGNYLGHGRAIIATVDELLRFRRWFLTLSGAEPWDIAYLRGAQEEMWQKLLQIQFATAPAEVLEWMLGQGIGATLAAYGANAELARARVREGPLSLSRWTNELRRVMHQHPGHDELMTALRRYAVTDDRRLLFVHAGIDPAKPLAEQRDNFWWAGAGLGQLSEPFEGFVRVVRGYDRRRRGREAMAHALSVDGGAGFGGPLNAVCLAPDGDIQQWLEG